jgi:hypothetical protein
MQSGSWLNKRGKGTFTLVTMAVLLAGLGCGSGGTGLETDAKTDAGAEGTVIGPDGGVVSFDGGQLSVPAGALKKAVRITVAEAGDSAEGFTALGRVFLFGPEGLKFEKPAVVTFEYNKTDLPDYAAREDVRVFWTDRDGAFQALKSTVAEGAVSAGIDHFSKGFAGVGKRVCCDTKDGKRFMPVERCEDVGGQQRPDNICDSE